MRLSISNIAWLHSQDEEMYQYLADKGFDGIEIAPTRLVPNNPYDKIDDSVRIIQRIKDKYQLAVSSMQSIWFGRTESIFSTEEDRIKLIDYTEKAVNYAQRIGCKNLVFGCPKNRNMDDKNKYGIAIDFFSKLAELAKNYGVVIALEPNPVIYNTNFMNTTQEAIQFVKVINSDSLMVNLDLGTVIWNDENLVEAMENIELIHHIHISEPYLAQIAHRSLHAKLKDILQEKDYNRFVSIEMGNHNNLENVKKTINYVNEVMR